MLAAGSYRSGKVGKTFSLLEILTCHDTSLLCSFEPVDFPLEILVYGKL